MKTVCPTVVFLILKVYILGASSFNVPLTYVDGRFLLVSSKDPDLDVGPHQSGNGLWHASLETVLNGSGAQQH